MNKRRYAVCGVSSRAIYSWIKPMYEIFQDESELVALLDIDPLRFEICKREFPQSCNVPEYRPDEFEKMISETKPDAIFVVGVDKTHVDYILAALAHDLDVISEKPMTTCWEDAVRVREAEKRSKGKVICTFNYRYTPKHRKIREMMLEGKVGRITHIDLNWYVDINHGASYFNRWNRQRENSGSLSIHKSSHHFDLINWWIGGGTPLKVNAFGDLNHYGPNSEFNPSRKDGRHCNGCAERRKCAYHSRWESRAAAVKIHDDHLEHFDCSLGTLYTPEMYRPDMCFFDSCVDIHDTIIANIKYTNGVLLNYSVNFSTPYEGYRLAINGTRGRLEAEEWGGMGATGFEVPQQAKQFIDYYPIFETKERIWIKPGIGAHGGGDIGIAEDVFMGEDPDRKYDILANSRDGLAAIAIGDAVYKSIVGEETIDLTEVMSH